VSFGRDQRCHWEPKRRQLLLSPTSKSPTTSSHLTETFGTPKKKNLRRCMIIRSPALLLKIESQSMLPQNLWFRKQSNDIFLKWKDEQKFRTIRQASSQAEQIYVPPSRFGSHQKRRATQAKPQVHANWKCQDRNQCRLSRYRRYQRRQGMRQSCRKERVKHFKATPDDRNFSVTIHVSCYQHCWGFRTGSQQAAKRLPTGS
jgi:hypothetical protein